MSNKSKATEWPESSKAKFLTNYLCMKFQEMGYDKDEATEKVRNYAGIIIGGAQRKLSAKEILNNVYRKFLSRPANYHEVWYKESFKQFARETRIPYTPFNRLSMVPFTEGVRMNDNGEDADF